MAWRVQRSRPGTVQGGREGQTQAKIAATLGVSQRTVSNDLRDVSNVANDEPATITDTLGRKQVAQMRAEGQTQSKIAATLGVSQSTVRNDLQKDVSTSTNDASEPPTVADDLAHVSGSGHVEPNTITDTLGRKQPAKKALHECQECGESFTRPVWHCARCGEHWDAGSTVVEPTEAAGVSPEGDVTEAAAGRGRTVQRVAQFHLLALGRWRRGTSRLARP